MSQVRSLVGDRISLLVQTASAIGVSFITGLIIFWRLALAIISIQPLIIFCYYIKKVLLTRFAVETAKAQQDASQVASEAVAQHRTVTAFSAQDKVSIALWSFQGNKISYEGLRWTLISSSLVIFSERRRPLS